MSDAESEADALQQETLLRIGITLDRPAPRRTDGVAPHPVDHTPAASGVRQGPRGGNRSSCPALVSALRDPRGRAVIPDVVPIEDAGQRRARRARRRLQRGAVDARRRRPRADRGPAARRLRHLRHDGPAHAKPDRPPAGPARRARSRCRRPRVLANYYQLDHLATRMRRNSESLLVLANAESRRRRTKATDVDDVVRAAIGEVEDYRRIDVLNLDHLQVRGAVVADISHLLAELLDNASSFSPPESRVTVSGRYAGEHYLISIADEGVGIGADRLVRAQRHPRTPARSSACRSSRRSACRSCRCSPTSTGCTYGSCRRRRVSWSRSVLPSKMYGPIDATGCSESSRRRTVTASRCPTASSIGSGDPALTDTFVPDVVSAESPTAPVEPTFEPEWALGATTTPLSDTTVQAEPAGESFVEAEPTFEPIAELTFEPEWSIAPDVPAHARVDGRRRSGRCRRNRGSGTRGARARGAGAGRRARAIRLHGTPVARSPERRVRSTAGAAGVRHPSPHRARSRIRPRGRSPLGASNRNGRSPPATPSRRCRPGPAAVPDPTVRTAWPPSSPVRSASPWDMAPRPPRVR